MSKLIFFLAVADMAVNLNSLYKNTTSDKRILFEFMEVNDWFGITALESKKPLITEADFEKLKETLTLWLVAYRRTDAEKVEIILNHFSTIYPKTCRLYREFVSAKGVENEPTAWKLLDYLFSVIDREICDYDESELEQLIKPMDKGATLVVVRTFTEFLQTAKQNGKPLTKWAYAFEPRDNTEFINEAYPMNDFAVMAYCTFNDEMWTKHNLIEKAINSKRSADIWLFTAFHFICALRLSDIKRLPAPRLPYDRGTVLRKISENTFENQEASALVDELIIRLKLKPLKPFKTSAHGKIPELKLFVPESLKVPFGIILAINLAHHHEVHEGNAFAARWYDKGNRNRINMRNFFGEDFAKSLRGKNFSSRCANRAYLQGIESVAGNDDAYGKPKGYMLAALARSHKGGIGNLAKTTEIYLSDGRFSGCSPEFIIREMFERGIFSFIPAILLEMYAGEEYKLLPVRLQTKLIGEVGLTAQQIESVATTVDRALEKSARVVSDVLRDTSKIHENIFAILQNIASGSATGHNEEYLCLMTAAGLPCISVDRPVCIGCGYEIYTKSAMQSLMKEYARLTQLRKSAKQADAQRYQNILEQSVMPAVSEMINAMKLLYQDADMTDFFDIVERGLNCADSSV